MIVLGIDPSLTATGVAAIDGTRDVRLTTVTSKGHRDDSVEKRYDRIALLGLDITGFEPHADLAVIEYPTLSQGRQGGHLDRHGLWWMLIQRLTALRIPYAVATASARACYATGKGNAAKDVVLANVVRRYPGADVQDNNQADALVLAAMGWHHATGSPLVDLPQTHTRALAKVAWPQERAGNGSQPMRSAAS